MVQKSRVQGLIGRLDVIIGWNLARCHTRGHYSIQRSLPKQLLFREVHPAAKIHAHYVHIMVETQNRIAGARTIIGFQSNGVVAVLAHAFSPPITHISLNSSTEKATIIKYDPDICMSYLLHLLMIIISKTACIIAEYVLIAGYIIVLAYLAPLFLDERFLLLACVPDVDAVDAPLE